ncbi:hypothetical protein [Streptomyces sp. NPDC006879]|uniref:hypothetical protein n=1 Tax=Streptomyces sp. NPDC006879 TaxID=3364767 RepID=UPI0036A67D90
MTSFKTFTKMTDRSVAASCLLGLSTTASTRGTELFSVIPAGSLASLACLPPKRERNERPTQAPVAVMAAQALVYAPAAAGAGFPKQTTQHHTMWAFRGLEPWSDPV